MLLVVLGELLLKEGLLFKEFAMLVTHRKDGDVFFNVMSQKKKICRIHNLKVCLLA